MMSLLHRIRTRFRGGADVPGARARLSEMLAELQRADPIYLPSKFWEDLNQVNTAQLMDEGFDNFKRTVNQNYFNWGPNSADDNQLKNLQSHWQAASKAEPALATLEGNHRLLNMFNSDMLDTAEKARIYVRFVSLLWWFAGRNDPGNLTAALAEPEIGNPLAIMLGGKCVSQDLANSIREYNAVREFGGFDPARRTVVAEIGAGYGRVAYVFLKASCCKYLIFDVPPALYVSERYLGEAVPDKKIFRFRSFAGFSEIEKELESADVGFFTPNQLALFPPGYLDVSLSISALHEMRREQIENFMKRMGELTSKAIYLKNWAHWHNAADDVMIDENTFQFSAPWKLAMARIDQVQDMFSEKVFTREL